VEVNLEGMHALARAERVTRALNDLWRGQAVAPELKQELWLLARESPALRRRAEAGALAETPVRGE
jgi:hypothetical protein